MSGRLLLFCLAFWVCHAVANERPALENIQIFEDRSGSMQLDRVLAQPSGLQSGFLPGTPSRLQPGFSRSAWWLRATLVNDSAINLPVVLAIDDLYIDSVDFHIERNGRWTPYPAAPASNDALTAPSRTPAIHLTLAPGEHLPVLIRITSSNALGLTPMALSESAWQTLQQRSSLWDGGLFGGLLALAWFALLISIFSRSVSFFILAALCVDITLFEAAFRGYTRVYLWPHATQWAPRSPVVFGYLAILLFVAFIFRIARNEKIRLPLHHVFVAFAWLEGIGLVGALFGQLSFFSQFSNWLNTAFNLTMVATAALLVRRGTPTARLMLITAVFVLFNFATRTLETRGQLPTWLAWVSSDIHPNPIIAVIGLGTNLMVLAAWINHVGRQRVEARTKLDEWQKSEQDRLRDEVARRTLELNDALAYAEEKNQQKVETVGYIGHDLRAPLSTIGGYSKLLLGSARKDQVKLIHAIERSVEYQLGLIDELMEYTKAELRPLDVIPHPTDLLALLGDISEYAVALCTQQDNEFHYLPLTPLPTLLNIDGPRLQQVLLNLLSNASKFTRDGTVTLSIKARKQDDNSYRIGFVVANTGIGIDLDLETDIFNAYRQVQAISGSTGLGLFIAQRIVDAMGGELRVASSPGHGTLFSFEIVASVAGDEMAVWIDTPRTSRRRRLDNLARTDVTPYSDLPPEDDLAELADFARNGRLTDIERWIGKFAPFAIYDDFLAQLQKHLDALNFPGIETCVAATLKQNGRSMSQSYCVT